MGPLRTYVCVCTRVCVHLLLPGSVVDDLVPVETTPGLSGVARVCVRACVCTRVCSPSPSWTGGRWSRTGSPGPSGITHACACVRACVYVRVCVVRGEEGRVGVETDTGWVRGCEESVLLPFCPQTVWREGGYFIRRGRGWDRSPSSSSPRTSFCPFRQPRVNSRYQRTGLYGLMCWYPMCNERMV